MTPSEAKAEICGAAEDMTRRSGASSNVTIVCSYALAELYLDATRWPITLAAVRNARASGRPYWVLTSDFGTANNGVALWVHPRVTAGIFGFTPMPTDESWDSLLGGAWLLTPDAALAGMAAAADAEGTYTVRWCEQPPAGVRWVDSRHAVVEREDSRTGETVVERVYVLVREGVFAVCDEEQAAVVLDVIATAGEVMGAGKRKPGVVRKALRWVEVAQ